MEPVAKDQVVVQYSGKPIVREIKRIDSLSISKLNAERTFDAHGPLKIPDRTREIYTDQYLNVPTEPGNGKYNALKTSFPNIEFYRSGSGIECVATIAKTRYLIGEAFRDFVKENHHTQTEYEEMSTNMANVSIITFVKHKGIHYIAAQIKGKVIGQGELHTGFYAENIDARFLEYDSPLEQAVKEGVEKKTGIPYDFLNPSDFVGMVDERITGQVNFAKLSGVHDLQDVQHHWDSNIKTGKKQIAGLALVPVEGYKITELWGGKKRLENLVWYKAENEPVKQAPTSFVIRPFTDATMKSLKYLEKRIGI